jgi:formylglycine-generating enzyme required for sulfatase activity
MKAKARVQQAWVIIAVCGATFVVYSLRAQAPEKVAAPKTFPVIEFVTIAAGEFMMGCSPDDAQCSPDENPLHKVRITREFEIGKYEVTQAQWVAVMQDNPSSTKGDNLPVETVSKLEARTFANRLNAQNDGYHYRLPSEAEWEYAARAGRQTPYSGALDQVAWYSANSEDEVHPVGQKRPNAWGLYDVQGNVREWVTDLYGANYYRTSPEADPTGPTMSDRGRGPGGPNGKGPPFPGGFGKGKGKGKAAPRPVDGASTNEEYDQLDGLPNGLPVARGGGWDQSAAFQRVSARYTYYGPTLRVSDIGFRVVRQRVVTADGDASKIK